MRVLVAGSRLFTAGYRIDRALLRASRGKDTHDMTLVVLEVRPGSSRTRSGAERIARDIADESCWNLDRVESVSRAQADLCLAFLSHEDDHDDRSRIITMKAEKAGIPVWRYYEGGPRAPHHDPIMAAPVFEPAYAAWDVDVSTYTYVDVA